MTHSSKVKAEAKASAKTTRLSEIPDVRRSDENRPRIVTHPGGDTEIASARTGTIQGQRVFIAAG